MSAEDKQQELELKKLEYPYYTYGQLMNRVIDVQRSTAWSNTSKPNQIFLNIEFLKDYLAYKPNEIESIIDLYIAINKLDKRSKKVILLLMSGHNHEDIAKIFVLSRSTITKLYNKAIKQLREILC
jgi:DNA-directed RNA polymerase specialized sigma subunit